MNAEHSLCRDVERVEVTAFLRVSMIAEKGRTPLEKWEFVGVSLGHTSSLSNTILSFFSTASPFFLACEHVGMSRRLFIAMCVGGRGQPAYV
jgi:hypothetical protein